MKFREINDLQVSSLSRRINMSIPSLARLRQIIEKVGNILCFSFVDGSDVKLRCERLATAAHVRC